MKVLITGSNGFVGKHLSQMLSPDYLIIRHGRAVKVPAVKNSYFHLDVNGRSDWQEHLKGVDVIIHLAASAHNKSNVEESIDEVNVNGALSLARQAATAGVKRLIFISTIGVSGNKTTKPINEKTAECPHSDYANSKLKAEKALLELAKITSLEVVIIRPVLVYGNMAPGNFSKLRSLINKIPILPFGLINNNRSFISVGNLVSFIELCIEHPKAKNEIFCIADGVDVSIKVFTDFIAVGISKKLFQFPLPIWFIQYAGFFFDKEDMVEQLVGNLQVDISKAKNLLGWAPVETMAQAMNKLR
jgi:nucleoside-diphosphate-sugar epimerase